MRFAIDTLNLATIERTLCAEALTAAGSIVDAAALLGITRHALKRRIVKHNIEWPVRAARLPAPLAPAPGLAAAAPQPPAPALA